MSLLFKGWSDPSQWEWPLPKGDDMFPDLSSLMEVARMIHETARAKGFWRDGVDRNNGELLMLVVSELGELLEGLRHGNPRSEHIPEFSCAEEECADVFIRLLDIAYARRWRLADAIRAKMLFNNTRPHLHGKAF